MCHAGKTLTDLQEIADTFATHFGAVYLKSSGLSNSVVEHIFTSNNISLYFNISKVFEFCLINLTKGPGPDQLPPQFLRECAFSLSRPLWIIFNNSVSTGIFPDMILSLFLKLEAKGTLYLIIDQFQRYL